MFNFQKNFEAIFSFGFFVNSSIEQFIFDVNNDCDVELRKIQHGSQCCQYNEPI